MSSLVHLYAFDEVADGLELLPVAARRALDALGLKVSLATWQGLPLLARRELVELGSQHAVDTVGLKNWAAALQVDGELRPPRPEPSPEQVPRRVLDAFGTTRPIPEATWAALTPLDRYTLDKIAERGRAERLGAAYAEIVGESALSTHLAPSGGVRMVDVGAKRATHRVAVASSQVRMNTEAFTRLSANNPKGDVLGTARIAGIMAAKRTAELIPLCHPIVLTKVEVSLSPSELTSAIDVLARVECVGPTGVEMEALTAASVAALTIYDMLKAFDKGMLIGPTRLLEKRGGRSGDHQA